jgi:uncharacterized membrane protein YfcA
MTLFPDLAPSALLLAATVACFAGVVKGLSGFAMPMILISGLSLFLPPQIALAGLILPTLVTNVMQALRQGLAAAWASAARFRLFLLAGLIFLLISAQLVALLPAKILFLIIGLPVTAFALLQLSGRVFRLAPDNRRAEAAVGAVSGFIGGLSGVWGPPTVAYLTALDLPKADHVRAQGVIYALGALALFGAHLQSGILGTATLPFSALLILPAVAGMMLGQRIQDRIDQKQFRRVILFVLLVAGLNLVRRGLT